MKISMVILSFFAFHSSTSFSQDADTNIKKTEIHYTSKAPKIDGDVKGMEWRKAKWSNPFVDISDSSKGLPHLKTRFKMQWDSNFLYIAAFLEEPNLWASLKNHDDIIFNDNDLEVFIDANNDGEQYFEIEINAYNTIMDLFMNKPYKKGGTYEMQWNTDGMTSAIKLNGTLNKNSVVDKGWTIEMAIPFNSLKREGRISHPTTGSIWRINFSRVEWQLEKSGLGYTKKKDSNGKLMRENNWVWSPMGIIDMHIPEKWGYLYFIK